jgi:hypothetical protein
MMATRIRSRTTARDGHLELHAAVLVAGDTADEVVLAGGLEGHGAPAC